MIDQQRRMYIPLAHPPNAFWLGESMYFDGLMEIVHFRSASVNVKSNSNNGEAIPICYLKALP